MTWVRPGPTSGDREMEHQQNNCGAFLCNEDWRTFEHKHTDLPWSHIWKWQRHIPSQMLVLIPPYIYFLASYDLCTDPPSIHLQKNVSEMIFTPGTWSNLHQKFDFMVFFPQTPFEDFGSASVSLAATYFCEAWNCSDGTSHSNSSHF